MKTKSDPDVTNFFNCLYSALLFLINPIYHSTKRLPHLRQPIISLIVCLLLAAILTVTAILAHADVLFPVIAYRRGVADRTNCKSLFRAAGIRLENFIRHIIKERIFHRHLFSVYINGRIRRADTAAGDFIELVNVKFVVI